MNRSIQILLLCLLIGCGSNREVATSGFHPDKSMKFVVKDRRHTNIDFANVVRESQFLNYYSFAYIYAGAGVAVGDINNDNLPDIFFVGNDVKNRLYLNEGGLKFQDISVQAGIQGKEKLRWSTGVTMADVNADGLLDIYVCVSGPSPDKKNLLYINNGDLTFSEKAKSFGLDDSGYSNQATFFDFDNDGDLDMYLASYPPCDFENPNSFYVKKQQTATYEETDKLYENLGDGSFIDITARSGVFNYGLSLNASVSDFNNDGWYDIYVSNDFNSADFMYINQKDGTFRNELMSYTNHTSNFGMGCDASDFNNDGLIDLVQMDMMAKTNFSQKRNMSAMNPRIFNEAVELGLHHQYMRNCLQLNNGNGTFSDIAELAGVANTDWSWSSLFADLNNDGWKDLFVTNGMRRSVNNKDFVIKATGLIHSGQVPNGKEYLLSNQMPVEPVANKLYVNNADLTFSEHIDPDGLSYEGFTHGAAYADLDLDGDLDMVISNLDRMAMVVENQSEENGYLRLKFSGKKMNTDAIGVKAKIIHNGQSQLQELILTRGYLSSVEPVLHFGLGKVEYIDTLIITWPGGNDQLLTRVKGNQTLKVEEGDTKDIVNTTSPSRYFSEITENVVVDYKHSENEFDDFEKQVLLPHKLSQFGPAIAVGDLNEDGLDDLYIGGATGQTAQLFLQSKNGAFYPLDNAPFQRDKGKEDVGAVFFDADNDGDLDLYVISGGNEFPQGSEQYQDRFYQNEGLGRFVLKTEALPKMTQSGSAVKPADFDKDGDLDLFVGGRLNPWDYPAPASSSILRNDGGTFVDISHEIAPSLEKIGLVTDAVWTDHNSDGNLDLLIVGEWMPITLLEQVEGKFVKRNDTSTLAGTSGWWYSIEASDLDGDGDDDYVVGNLGLNYKYKATHAEPFEVYYGDFDSSGSKDLALGFYENEVLYPVRGRQCSSEQIPSIKEKFKSYDAFARASFYDVYEVEDNLGFLHHKAHTFASVLITNEGNGRFVLTELPTLAQFSSVNDILIRDFNGDRIKDMVLGGNLFQAEVETPRNDASIGAFLLGSLHNGKYSVQPVHQSGLKLNRDLKALRQIHLVNKDVLIAVNNDDYLQVFEYLR